MVVASIVRSVAMSRDMNDLQYLRGTSLLQGLKPWLRYLDANEHHKFLKLVLSDMGECALSVIREAERFDEAFVHSFCISTLEEYSVSRCQNFSRQVLSLLFPSKEAKTSLNLKIMMSVLKFVAGEFQQSSSRVRYAAV
ncbi:putative separase [Arabidopsis thaliana]